MDGTGSLLLDFAAALGTEFEVIFVSYPPHQALDYAALERIVYKRLPSSGPYVLLAESFSGPLAISIAASRPVGLAALVLVCTFARYPRPAFRALRILIPLIRVSRFPESLMWPLLLGRWSTAALQRSISAALTKVPIATLRSRLRGVLTVDVLAKLKQISVPLLLRARCH
jgi:pimeloyl-[acyl-carrier protein] methyl ester esterase